MRERVKLPPEAGNAENGEGGDMESIKFNRGEQVITVEIPESGGGYGEITGRGDTAALAGEIAILLEHNGGTMPIFNLLEGYRRTTHQLNGPIWDAYRYALRSEPPMLAESDDGINVSIVPPRSGTD
jgi:hypothetical protein